MAGRARRGGYAERMVPMRRPGESGIIDVGGPDLQTLLKKIDQLRVNDVDKKLEEEIDSMFEQLCRSKESLQDVLFNIHHKALADVQFGRKAIMALEKRCGSSVEGVMVRSEFLKYLQSDFNNRAETFGNQKAKFANSVMLLGEFFHKVKIEGEPITILAVALITCMEMLLAGGEEELQVFTTLLVLNGKLLKDLENVARQYEVLKHTLRTALVKREDLSCLSRSWHLLAIDIIAANGVHMKGVLRDFYLANIGDDFLALEMVSNIEPEVDKLTAAVKTTTLTNHSGTPSDVNDEEEYRETEIDRVKEQMRLKVAEAAKNMKADVQRVRDRMPAKDKNFPRRMEGWKLSDDEKIWDLKERKKNDHIQHDDRCERDDDFYGIQAPRVAAGRSSRSSGTHGSRKDGAPRRQPALETPLPDPEETWD